MANRHKRSHFHQSTKHPPKKLLKFHRSLSLVSHPSYLEPTSFHAEYADITLAIVTVEKAAAAKIHLECHYNELLNKQHTPRSIRRQELDAELNNDITKTPAEKEEKRKVLQQLESNHLRESRDMKARGFRALKGIGHVTSNYEPIKILGKGSFGVVRLVREKQDPAYVNSNK